MPSNNGYKRVVVKISGESFCRPGGSGIDPSAMAALVAELLPLRDLGVQAALVVGGGNFIRGRKLADAINVRRITADYMGMAATVINALALRDALAASGRDVRVLSAVQMSGPCEPFHPDSAVRHLEKGRMIILAGGTGSPFLTTDTCAALRAREIAAEALLKGTKVDGVYDADPVTCPGAKKHDRLSYEQVLAERLGVMDLAAVSICMEGGIPIIVFELSRPGRLAAAVRGEKVGTMVCG